MISLLVKNYTIDEKETLLGLLDYSFECLRNYYCGETCTECQYRKVCDDITRARLFLADDINGINN